MNKNEMHRVPGFTAEQALEQGAATPYAGLALRGEGGGAVEPAFIWRSHCQWTSEGLLCWPVLQLPYAPFGPLGQG
jgi:hypothetical protein